MGPQRAPGLRTDKATRSYAAAPSPAANNGTFVSAGDWSGRRAPVKCTKPPADPSGVGRCTDLCDQLYNTCPLPTDLPKGTVPPKGGPVGSDTPVKTPMVLTPGEVDNAVSKGQLKRQAAGQREDDNAMGINGAATYAAAAPHPAAPSPAHANAAGNATIEAVINTGDSWAIRNTNCEIAPIHGVLNRVCTEP